MINKVKHQILLFLFAFFIHDCLNASYTEEAPVKLLEVEAFADRYPASDSKYRLYLLNGYVSGYTYFEYLYI